MPRKKEFRIYNVRDIIKIEEKEKNRASVGDKIAGVVTRSAGNMVFVLMHLFIFSIWIAINAGLIPGITPFDPFPFSLLTTAVSLEAIFLSIFVLVSQNRQSATADRRAKIDLQINTIAERETTEIIRMILDIQKYIGMNKKADKEISELKQKTDLKRVAREIAEAENN